MPGDNLPVLETEQPKVRDLHAIQAEYSQVCMQAGDLQYRAICNENALVELNNKLNSLNMEAAQLKSQQTVAESAAPMASVSTNPLYEPAAAAQGGN